MPLQNKQELNEQFYNLLKEIVDSQTEIIKRLDRIEQNLGKAEKPVKSMSDLWRDM